LFVPKCLERIISLLDEAFIGLLISGMLRLITLFRIGVPIISVILGRAYYEMAPISEPWRSILFVILFGSIAIVVIAIYDRFQHPDDPY
jgi:hypothetical protein